jgi:protein ImuA
MTVHTDPLTSLLQNNPLIWRGSQCANRVQVCASGWPALDGLLPHGGWPLGNLIELIVPTWGIGELQLLLPTLIQLAPKMSIWLDPPHQPYAPALLQQGVDLTLVRLMHTPQPQQLWAMEQLLASQSVGSVLCWAKGISMLQLRRLQLATAKGGGLGFLFSSTAQTTGTTAMRLELSGAPNLIKIRLLKAKGLLQPRVLKLPLTALDGIPIPVLDHHHEA